MLGIAGYVLGEVCMPVKLENIFLMEEPTEQSHSEYTPCTRFPRQECGQNMVES